MRTHALRTGHPKGHVQEMDMRARLAVLFLLAGAAIAAGAAPSEPVGFTRKPTAARTTDGVRIEFAVNRPTDVAVFIESPKGEVVRHLVAGVLGPNPPAPLKADSLRQTVTWDGKADYGKDPGDGPFRVRVALGLGAAFDRIAASTPQHMEHPAAMGIGPDGTLYVRNLSSPAVWSHTQLLALNRDGIYQRTLFPFPATLSHDQVRAYGVMTLDGRPAPVDAFQESKVDLLDRFSGSHGPAYSSIALSNDGRDLYLLLGRRRPYAEPGIARVTRDGACPAPPLCEPLAPGKGLGVAGKRNAPVALSSDGTRLFFAGLSSDRNGNRTFSAVYSVAVPKRKGMKVFFGDPRQPGRGKDRLGAAPTGLAVDGRGHLLIADGANNRVLVVGEEDGASVGEIAVERVNCLGASRKTGAIYATTAGGRRSTLFRLDSWQAKKPSDEFLLPGFQHAMAVDPSAERPIVWFGTRVGVLLRIEDGPKGFSARTISPGFRDPKGTEEGYLGLVVDRLRKEIYVRNGDRGRTWQRFCEKTGRMETIHLAAGAGGGGHGVQLTPAPDGNLYGLRWKCQFYKWDRNGKPLPWTSPRRPEPGDYFSTMPEPNRKKGIDQFIQPHISLVPVAMGELPHTLGVRWSDGHFLVQEALISRPGAGARTMKALHEHAPSGKRLTGFDSPIIWKMSDAAVGPRTDAAGNIYIAETVRPKGWVCPAELKAALADMPATRRTDLERRFGALYGSIVKFTPQGGMFHFATEGAADTGPDPFKGKANLEGLKSAEYDYWRQTLKPIRVTGDEWVHPGIGHVGFYGCNCENVTFDVDEFGRVFFPDLSLFRVRVIDTAGNAIMHFGGYGNPESAGPASPVPQPEIAFAWLTGVGVTDRYAYMGDTMNRRLLRARLTYVAEETCELRP